MKTHIILLSLFAVCLLTACEKELNIQQVQDLEEDVLMTDIKDNAQTMDTDTIFANPIDVSFTALSVTVCTQQLSANTIYVINSIEEFNELICQNSIPAIDFNTHSVILTYGHTTSGIANLTKNLQQLSTNEYELTVDITLGMTCVAEVWSVVILTQKLPQGANVTLNEVQHY